MVLYTSVMIAGIILAAGKGTRFGAEGVNKTTVLLQGKPLVRYAAELLAKVCDDCRVVVGVYAESVMKAVEGLPVSFVTQGDEAQGTGYATKCAVEVMIKEQVDPEVVVVGYGDHMMAYTEEVLNSLIESVKGNVAVSMVTTKHDEPSRLRWGRIIRDDREMIARIVEEKEASEEERRITELNAGLYAFSWEFLKVSSMKLQPAGVSGEYYLTDLIGLAVESGYDVRPVAVPFEMVGWGVNTPEDLQESEKALVTISE